MTTRSAFAWGRRQSTLTEPKRECGPSLMDTPAPMLVKLRREMAAASPTVTQEAPRRALAKAGTERVERRHA